ncbi:SusC/RagA family TonB-linked outer membrane protein [Desertivirga brevis]|uniref:SusC/RagA family TonB-linked outer membrane protein n=1 Tax=Desertivirga brevis TaxID=2810310 RepID=UPI001A96B857|nr:TonB-dependent receptor [Pedobacter sp. SYSU D00873]
MRKLLLIIPLIMAVLAASGQERKITGKLTEKGSGAPIIGASIVNEQTKKGANTDVNGVFNIIAQTGETIRITYIGFESLTYRVGANDNTLSLSLQESVASLESVVVTGYQQERKKDLTGAVAVVDVTDMKKQSVANPMKALQGQVAGVYITGNGSPSSPATVRIRGIGTLNNNDPLYVIDGVPTKAGMHELNQADIESIQILKDAASASIYGSRAANGVIVITTKRGKKGSLQLNANAYTSLSNYNSRTEMLDAEGYGRALWQASINSGATPDNNSIQYKFDWGVDPASGQPTLRKVLIPEYLDANQTIRASNTDWFDEISETGVIQNYDVSVSNGTENGNYLLSLGYFDNKGVIKTNSFDRISARLNSDYRLFKGKLVLGQNLSFNKTNEVSTTPLNEAMQALPIIPVHTVDGIGWGGPIGGMNDRQNPVRLLEDNKQNGYDYTRLFGNFYGDLSLAKHLKFRSNFGIDYGNYTARRWRKAYQSGYLNNPVNRLESNQSHNVRTTWSNTLNYNAVIKDHRIDAFAGTELNTENLNSFWASRESFVVEDPDFMYLDAGTGTKDNGGSGAKNVLFSYLARANYSFKDRYLISGTIRYDGSSRFGQNNRFGAFPAFSAGWRLSEEGFFKKLGSAFDDLKLRYSWGKVGNQEINNNAIFGLYVTDYNTTAYDLNGNKSGVLPSGYKLIQNPNADLRWEATTNSNWGVDFSLWSQKLYGSAEYFTKETSDILLLPPYIGVLGEGGNRWVNGASMENKGWEFMLGHRSSLGKDLKLDLNANFDRIRNKVTKLPAEVVNAYGGDGRGQNILGYTLGSHFGYVADGLFRSQAEVDAHANQNGKAPGRIRYSDLNSDGVINDYDRTWIGNPLPKFNYGFNANINYKNIDFSFLLQGIGDVDVVNGFKYHTDFWSVSETGSNKGTRLLNAWTPANPGSDIPALSLTDNNWEGRFSTYYIENGSYLKLRNAQLGYTFKKQAVSRIGLQSLRLYIGGDNLAILAKSTSFTGIDPENPGFGYPNPMVITAGANIRL